MKAEYKRCLLVWLCLMTLLALTFGSAWLSMGVWNGIVNLGIAALKAGLVAAFFMHLNTGSGLIRIVAATALFVLSLLFSLSSGDYATRGAHPAPWQQPQQLPGATARR